MITYDVQKKQEVLRNLQSKLAWCFVSDDGTTYIYGGTIEAVKDFIQTFMRGESENK